MSPKQARTAPQGTSVKRRRYEEDSDSELSDIDDEEMAVPAGAAQQEDDDDEEEEEEEEQEEEEDEDEEEDENEESESPEEEVEESYVSDEQVSDDDDDSDMKSKPPAKRVAQRAVARTTASGRRAQAAKPAAATKKPVPQKATTKNTTVTPTPNRSGAPTIKLKIGKDRLRQVTSSWTPPPDAGGRQSAASKSAVTSAPRGRKIVQEESDDEEDEDEDESKMDEEEQPDDELGDEDAEGETDDELMDSDDEGATPGTDLSRTGTPDMSRLTNRQRTRLGDITTADLLELPSGYEKPGANKGITLSAHEQELKRAEMARRRKNLTDQKLEEEKMDTINRLLKKQTPKMRGKGRATGDATPADQDTVMGGIDLPGPPPPTMIRWVSNKDGCRLAVPGSWLAGPIGKQFEPQRETERMQNARRKLVEEL